MVGHAKRVALWPPGTLASSVPRFGRPADNRFDGNARPLPGMWSMVSWNAPFESATRCQAPFTNVELMLREVVGALGSHPIEAYLEAQAARSSPVTSPRCAMALCMDYDGSHWLRSMFKADCMTIPERGREPLYLDQTDTAIVHRTMIPDTLSLLACVSNASPSRPWPMLPSWVSNGLPLGFSTCSAAPPEAPTPYSLLQAGRRPWRSTCSQIRRRSTY